jgi:hypothetical protein
MYNISEDITKIDIHNTEILEHEKKPFKVLFQCLTLEKVHVPG